MGRNKDGGTLRTLEWAQDWPPCDPPGAPFYHGGGIAAEVLDVLREKGYVPTHFGPLTGEEKIEAMIAATQNGAYSPDAAQTKLIDLHLRQIRGKEKDSETSQVLEINDFLDLLQDFASKTRPEWVNVGTTPTPAPEPAAPDLIESLLADLK